jgi:glycosyltransferase involved in cell wall biosynthesis
MRIGIDGHALSIPFPCGSKHYAEQLVWMLAKIDKKNEYIVFSKNIIRIPEQDNFSLKIIKSKLPIFKRQLLLISEAIKQHVDLFHFLEPVGTILNGNLKIVTTVHDVDLSKTYPINIDPKTRLTSEILRYFTIKNSRMIITSTKIMTSEMKKYLSIFHWNKSIKIIPMSYDTSFINKKSVRRKYILAMGDFAPRKNILNVIFAFNNLPDRLKKNYSLKIVVSTKKVADKFRKTIDNYGFKSNIEILDHVSNIQLVNLYNKALVFIYASIYEGFGIPILEAMACGCPVITSNYGAMKETSGGAAVLVNPLSVAQLSSAILKVVKNKKLRTKISIQGLIRSAQYSWENTARKTIEVYKQVYAQK